MQFTESEEHQLIIKLVVREMSDGKFPGMMFGQLKRMKSQGISNYHIRIGLELMIAHGALNKRSGLKHVPEYIEEALRLESSDKIKMIDEKESRIVKIPLKINHDYRNKKLKDWSK